jgi:hypothetical protein
VKQRILAVAALTAALAAAAAPPPAHAGGDAKLEARALMESGVSHFRNGRFADALELFRSAYERYPSTKLLLNIGTTLKQLGRFREAAATYERYLVAADADPKRRDEVLGLLAEIDRALGRVHLISAAPDATVTIDGEAVDPTARIRVEPGDHVLRASRPGFVPLELTVSLRAGEQKSVNLALAVQPSSDVPDTAGRPTRVTVRSEPEPQPVDAALTSRRGSEAPGNVPAATAPSWLGASLQVVVDYQGRGAAVKPGLTVALSDRLTVVGAGSFGALQGAYLGLSARLGRGRIQPAIAVGLPLFFGEQLIYGGRAAAGIDIALGRHLSVEAELGVEGYLGTDQMYERFSIAPALGVKARL